MTNTDTPKEVFICKVCGKEFDFYNDWYYHYDMVHNQGLEE